MASPYLLEDGTIVTTDTPPAGAKPIVISATAPTSPAVNTVWLQTGI